MNDEFNIICRKLKPFFKDKRGICSKANDILIENLSKILELDVIKFPSGECLEGWEVPKGWELLSGTVKIGNKLFTHENCELMVPFGTKSFSFKGKFSEIKNELIITASSEDFVSYRTQYYKENKKVICLPIKSANDISEDENIEINILSKEFDHHITIGELFVKGKSNKTIIISTYNCHPGLGNDNFSGLLSWTYLANQIKKRQNNFYSYRFVVAPETIGSIAYIKYLKQNNLKDRIIHSLILTCLGGKERNYSYKKSPYSNGYSRYLDKFLMNHPTEIDLREFSHDGSDERQYSSPGVNISSSSLCRNRYYEYPEYHTSADNWEYMNEDSVEESSLILLDLLNNADKNVRLPTSISKFGEPSLSSLGISFHIGGGSLNNSGEFEGINKKEFFDIYSFCNGNKSIDEIVEISKLNYISRDRLLKLIFKLLELKVVEF